MGAKEEYELDLKLGDEIGKSKRLHEEVVRLKRELVELRRALESINALSYKSLHDSQPERTE
jgi:hypothetical protein